MGRRIRSKLITAVNIANSRLIDRIPEWAISETNAIAAQIDNSLDKNLKEIRRKYIPFHDYTPGEKYFQLASTLENTSYDCVAITWNNRDKQSIDEYKKRRHLETIFTIEVISDLDFEIKQEGDSLLIGNSFLSDICQDEQFRILAFLLVHKRIKQVLLPISRTSATFLLAHGGYLNAALPVNILYQPAPEAHNVLSSMYPEFGEYVSKILILGDCAIEQLCIELGIAKNNILQLVTN